MSTDLTLRDTRLLDAASNNLSGLEIEEKFGIPAAEAISRIRRLLTERDIWTDIERKQLLLHSAFQLKGRIEAASVDVSDPKQIDVYLKLLKTVGELLDKLGVKLTTLSKAQADYIGVPQHGPFKADHYRY